MQSSQLFEFSVSRVSLILAQCVEGYITLTLTLIKGAGNIFLRHADTQYTQQTRCSIYVDVLLLRLKTLYSEYFDEIHLVVLYDNMVLIDVYIAVKQNKCIKSVIARYMLRSSLTSYMSWTCHKSILKSVRSQKFYNCHNLWLLWILSLNISLLLKPWCIII
jgi:hypothetical protein